MLYYTLVVKIKVTQHIPGFGFSSKPKESSLLILKQGFGHKKLFFRLENPDFLKKIQNLRHVFYWVTFCDLPNASMSQNEQLHWVGWSEFVCLRRFVEMQNSQKERFLCFFSLTFYRVVISMKMTIVLHLRAGEES